MEEICHFPELPARKPLTYQAKQLIAHEIEMEKMRRTEALARAGDSPQVSCPGSGPEPGPRQEGCRKGPCPWSGPAQSAFTTRFCRQRELPRQVLGRKGRSCPPRAATSSGWSAS